MRNIIMFLTFIFSGMGGGGPAAMAFDLPYAYPAVLGPAINILPEGFVTINVGSEVFYYCHGIFYQKIERDQKYAIVPAPIGAVVFALPPGYQYMYVNGVAYYIYRGIYYKRVLEGYRVIYPPV